MSGTGIVSVHWPDDRTDNAACTAAVQKALIAARALIFCDDERIVFSRDLVLIEDSQGGVTLQLKDSVAGPVLGCERNVGSIGWEGGPTADAGAVIRLAMSRDSRTVTRSDVADLSETERSA